MTKNLITTWRWVIIIWKCSKKILWEISTAFHLQKFGKGKLRHSMIICAWNRCLPPKLASGPQVSFFSTTFCQNLKKSGQIANNSGLSSWLRKYPEFMVGAYSPMEYLFLRKIHSFSSTEIVNAYENPTTYRILKM